MSLFLVKYYIEIYFLLIQNGNMHFQSHRSGRFSCWKAMGRFRSNFWRRIRIWNQNQPITSGFWDIWCYVLENGGFRYFWGYVQGARNFFGFFLKCHHLALRLPFKMIYWTVTSDSFSQWYGHIKFWHLSEQPYEHSHWLFGAYHSAFENLSWKFVLAGFDALWIRIYSQKIDISISKMADRNSRN